MKYIWISRADSLHFSFEAYGATKEEAAVAFAAGLRRHADKTGAQQSWVDEMVAEAEPRRIVLGTFYRDGEAIR